MKISILHRTIFTLILSGIMSASMTYMVSSFYCDPHINMLMLIWTQAWITAFTVIFTISPFLHIISAYITDFIKKVMVQ